MIRIENWLLGNANVSPYTAPELIRPSLSGNVYGHPRFDDGDVVTTSYIVDVNGRIVTTYSGSVYELGEPDAEYVQWCKDNAGYVPTQEVPIKFHRIENN